MTVLLIILVMVALFNIPDLARKKLWKELWVYCVLYAIVMTVVVLQNFGINVPSLVKGAMFLMKNILHIGYE